jgi:geranylgeranyl diphosphate synthase, type II
MDIKARLSEMRTSVDAYLDRLLPAESEAPSVIHKAMRHSIFAGGKRIRPILACASGTSIAGNDDLLLHLGAAIEMMHTYSLIHDDLPALDNDDLRRGVPTCHKVFGEAMAILAGDALMTLCYQVLSSLPKASDAAKVAIIREISCATGTVNGMIGGQVVDLESEGKPFTAEHLEYIHNAKTGALLRACVRCGALAADANESQLESMTQFGRKIGLVFQIVDDILDVTSSSEMLGKTVGKDEKVKKATYPALYGIEASRQKAKELTAAALEDIQSFGKEADLLRELARYMVGRST